MGAAARALAGAVLPRCCAAPAPPAARTPTDDARRRSQTESGAATLTRRSIAAVAVTASYRRMFPAVRLLNTASTNISVVHGPVSAPYRALKPLAGSVAFTS